MAADHRIARRAVEPTDDERLAGSDDPEAQAEAILAESDQRSVTPMPREQRTSDEATPPA